MYRWAISLAEIGATRVQLGQAISMTEMGAMQVQVERAIPMAGMGATRVQLVQAISMAEMGAMRVHSVNVACRILSGHPDHLVLSQSLWHVLVTGVGWRFRHVLWCQCRALTATMPSSVCSTSSVMRTPSVSLSVSTWMTSLARLLVRFHRNGSHPRLPHAGPAARGRHGWERGWRFFRPSNGDGF